LRSNKRSAEKNRERNITEVRRRGEEEERGGQKDEMRREEGRMQRR